MRCAVVSSTTNLGLACSLLVTVPACVPSGATKLADGMEMAAQACESSIEATLPVDSERIRKAALETVREMNLQVMKDTGGKADGVIETQSDRGRRIKIEYKPAGPGSTLLSVLSGRSTGDMLPYEVFHRIVTKATNSG